MAIRPKRTSLIFPNRGTRSRLRKPLTSYFKWDFLQPFFLSFPYSLIHLRPRLKFSRHVLSAGSLPRRQKTESNNEGLTKPRRRRQRKLSLLSNTMNSLFNKSEFMLFKLPRFYSVLLNFRDRFRKRTIKLSSRVSPKITKKCDALICLFIRLLFCLYCARKSFGTKGKIAENFALNNLKFLYSTRLC